MGVKTKLTPVDHGGLMLVQCQGPSHSLLMLELYPQYVEDCQINLP